MMMMMVESETNNRDDEEEKKGGRREGVRGVSGLDKAVCVELEQACTRRPDSEHRKKRNTDGRRSMTTGISFNMLLNMLPGNQVALAPSLH